MSELGLRREVIAVLVEYTRFASARGGLCRGCLRPFAGTGCAEGIGKVGVERVGVSACLTQYIYGLAVRLTENTDQKMLRADKRMPE